MSQRQRHLQRSLQHVVTDSFRPDVEGLRAVAVLVVVLFHAGIGWMKGGFVGVDVFFVLSGFLITRLLLRELYTSGTISLPAFWARRARRLLPASALVVLVTVVAAHWMLPPLSQQAVAGDVTAVALFVVNFRFASQLGDYFGAQLGALSPSPLLHFWSLAVEEQFYLVWPAAMLLVSRRPRAYRRLLSLLVVAVIVGSVAVSVWLTDTHPTWAFYLLPARMGELLAGAGLALARPWLRHADDRVRAAGGWVGLVMIIVISIGFDESIAFPGIAAALPVAATVLVVAAGGAKVPWSPAVVLEQRPLQWVGTHSYAIYLWHWPVLVLAEAKWGPLSLTTRLGLVALSFGLAAVSYALVENPVRHLPALTGAPRRSLALGGALVAATLLAGSVARAAVPSFDTGVEATTPTLVGASTVPGATASTQPGDTSPPSTAPLSGFDALLAGTQQLLAEGLQVQVVPSNLRPSLRSAFDDKPRLYPDGCVNIGVDDVVHDCVYGVTDSSKVMVLYGDSHAAHWFPALEKIATDRGMRLVVFTKGGCPTAEVAIPTNTLARTCPAWRSKVLAKIQALRPAMVVMSASHHYPNSDDEWRAGMDSIVAKVAPLTGDLVVLGDNPGASSIPAECLSQHLRSATSCVNRRERAVEGGRVEAERDVAAAHQARFVDTSDWLCTPDACPVVVGDILLYRDVNHLSTTAAELLTPLLDAALFPG